MKRASNEVLMDVDGGIAPAVIGLAIGATVLIVSMTYDHGKCKGWWR